MPRLPTLDDLDGPAPAWPAPLDAVLDLWAGLPGRGRVALRAAAAVVVALAMTGGLLRGPWGPSTPVVVAGHDLQPGTRVTTADLVTAQRPARLIPDDALRTPSELPAGAVADGHVPAGTVLTAAMVPNGRAGPDGTATVPVPADALPPLPVGTRLDLAVAAFDGGAEVVASGAVLVADDGTWRWVQVARDDVPAVARGISDGTLVAAVLPPARGGGP